MFSHLLSRSQACNDLCMAVSSIHLVENGTTTVSEKCILHPTLVNNLTNLASGMGKLLFIICRKNTS